MSLSQKNIFFLVSILIIPLAINYIILLGKQFIYKCKLHKIVSKLPVFISNIYDFIKIEFIIASTKLKLPPITQNGMGFYKLVDFCTPSLYLMTLSSTFLFTWCASRRG